MGRAVGIDLGTTTSEIAYIKDGKPIIIKNGNTAITPSIVGLDKELNVVVGNIAKNQMVSAKDRTVSKIKRKMGTKETVVMAGKKFTPVEISALILKELKALGEAFLKEEITDVVITVPAQFDNAQRQATIEAGEKAGLNVMRIINEPTAAALAFGVDNMDIEGKILVYDLGGGTFDVSILEMIEGSLDVKVSRGDNHLGGTDFDEKVVQYVVKKIQEVCQLDVSKDPMALQRIYDEVEKEKINLSNVKKTTINLPYIGIKDNGPVNFDMDITIEEYDKLIEDYVKRTMEVVNEALRDAKLKSDDIDIVLAIGGSSRTPLVIQSLEKIFGNKIQGGVNPDEAVALGAAVQAGILSNEISGERSIAIFDVCNYTLGTSVLNDRGDGLEYSRLIMRDTHLPFEKTRSYETSCDFQKSVKVKIYQGEDDDVSKNIKLGEYQVDGIPENYAGKEEIDITFKYTENGDLEVTTTIVSTGKQKSLKIDMYKYDPPKKREESLMDMADWGENTLVSEIKATFMLYQKHRNSLPDDKKQIADALVRQLKEAVAQNNSARVNQLDDELTALIFEFN